MFGRFFNLSASRSDLSALKKSNLTSFAHLAPGASPKASIYCAFCASDGASRKTRQVAALFDAFGTCCVMLCAACRMPYAASPNLDLDINLSLAVDLQIMSEYYRILHNN